VGRADAPVDTADEAQSAPVAQGDSDGAADVPASTAATTDAVETVAKADAVAAVEPAEAVAQVAVPAAEPTATAPAMPAVGHYDLPVDTLQQLASASGLQWVLSDADKIAAAQAAIAAEPKPVHVPRERKPVEVLDEGPLVLVETRKDLSQLNLPFDAQAAGARDAQAKADEAPTA
jgi:ribonuclease E